MQRSADLNGELGILKAGYGYGAVGYGGGAIWKGCGNGANDG